MVVELYVRPESPAQVVRETLEVEEVEPGLFRALRSPGLVEGLAAGDTFRVSKDQQPTIVARAGNVAVQVLHPMIGHEVGPYLLERVKRIGGWLDGSSPRLFVFTIPVSAGFSNIERVFESFSDRFPKACWCYLNVYDPRDGVSPLNWWM